MPQDSEVEEVAVQFGNLSIHVRVRTPAGTAGSAGAAPSSPLPAAPPASPSASSGAEDPWILWEAVAREAGLRAGRILRGEPCGSSPPKATNLANACWVVLRRSGGSDPAVVARRWADAKPLVSDSSGGGLSRHSLVQGFPSLREARIFVEAAGAQWRP